jgi:hypothetical protein
MNGHFHVLLAPTGTPVQLRPLLQRDGRDMAEPQKQPSAGASSVAECSATDCTHNDDRECHTGEIRVQITGDQAVCGTYDPGAPRTRP